MWHGPIEVGLNKRALTDDGIGPHDRRCYHCRARISQNSPCRGVGTAERRRCLPLLSFLTHYITFPSWGYAVLGDSYFSVLVDFCVRLKNGPGKPELTAAVGNGRKLLALKRPRRCPAEKVPSAAGLLVGYLPPISGSGCCAGWWAGSGGTGTMRGPGPGPECRHSYGPHSHSMYFVKLYPVPPLLTSVI